MNKALSKNRCKNKSILQMLIPSYKLEFKTEETYKKSDDVPSVALSYPGGFGARRAAQEPGRL
jgi:hypothetical protein